MIVAAMALLTAVGCDMSCDASAHESVRLSVFEADGTPAEAFDVSFTVDGSSARSGSCPGTFGEVFCGPNAGEASLAREWPGRFEVTVTSNGREVRGSVEVPDGQCHVGRRDLVLVLPDA